ncbi:lipopolysaccharide kinase InaA family protein [Pseudomonas sp. EL_65y_Pfl2_R95]|uniref:lipopolysaccharide kinase InaA family protein n=1 Tax=Pseudomonas sp. EL_65y_Pfl2_R95 TaxID=3088698 RepID=UPI0030D7B7D1
MKDFIASEEQRLLARHSLDSFEALWALQLEAVDEPNTERGGWSTVFRLELEDKAFYLKRQSNYLTHTLTHPLGEPTFSREFRNIQRYNELGIPALQAVFYAQRKVAGEQRALLLTRALDNWQDLDQLLPGWGVMPVAQRNAVLDACGLLARRLHASGQVHGCFYPKHIFLQARGEVYTAQLIDLEKTRPALWGDRDRVKDLEPLLRRAQVWTEADVQRFLSAYLGSSANMDHWLERLTRRRKTKAVSA